MVHHFVNRSKQENLSEELHHKTDSQSETHHTPETNHASIDFVLGLQRTIGNQATQQLLRKSLPALGSQNSDIDTTSKEHEPAFLRLRTYGSGSTKPLSTGENPVNEQLQPTVAPRVKSHIQRKSVPVSGGVFSDEGHPDGYKTYESEVTKAGGKRYLERGAQMSGLKFTPNKNLVNAAGEPATEVSLVQTTNSSVKDVQDPDKKDQVHSMLDERRTKSGSAIDQEIFMLPDARGYVGSTLWKSDELKNAITEIESGYVDHKIDEDTIINLSKDGRTPWSAEMAKYRKSFEDGGDKDKTQEASAANIRLIQSNMEAFIETQQGIITWFTTTTAAMSNEELEQAGAPAHWIAQRAIIPVQVQTTIDRVNNGVLPILETMLNEAETDKKEKMYKDADINLEPRYHEQRATEEAPLKETGTSDTDFSGTTGWPAHRETGEDDWAGDAMLRDRPAHEFVPDHILKGVEQFETVALADGDKFVGSVKWGWRINGRDPELHPSEIELVDYGEASDDFYEAAEKWNTMSVQDPKNKDVKHTTIQLPVREIVKSISLFEEKLGSPNSLNIAPDADKEDVKKLKNKIISAWPTTPKEFRTRYRSKLITVLDKYLMKIDRRRPSQEALIEQFGIDG